MKTFLLVTSLALGLGLGGTALASAPADIEPNLISQEGMDRLLASARQESQLAHRGDRRRGYDDGYRRHEYRSYSRHGYRHEYYPRHRYYDRGRYYGPRHDYDSRHHHRRDRW